MEEEKKKLPIWLLVVFIIILVLYAFAFFVSYLYMEESLFRERAEHTTVLMEKISQNVETGIETRWNSIRHFANRFSDTPFSTLNEVEEWLADTKSYQSSNILGLFMIDDKGICYTSSGKTFKWTQQDLLSSGKEEVHVSSDELRVSENDALRMFFLKKLPVEVTVDGHKLTHICLSTEMNFVDPFFNTDEFGEESVAFIIRPDGTQVYRSTAENPIADVYNVISALKSAEYKYGASHDTLKRDIADGNCGCTCLTYQGEVYYLVHHRMQTNSWTSIMMIPEGNIGTASADFMRSIIISVSVILLAGLAIFIFIFFVGSHQVNEQKKRVNTQLVRAAEAERSANEAKTHFLSSMSHDIRTPMNAIIGMTTLAAKHLDDPDYMRDCLANVSLASNHLLTLINDVLDISKVESGRMTLNPIVFSVADTATNLINIVKGQISAKGQAFDVRVHNVYAEYLFADELRLNQIFINILSNAVKYTPEGGRISVDFAEERIEGHEDLVRLRFIVEDNGVGMSEEFQATMYRSFTRADDNNIGTIQGTGLGLAISKQMVDLMHGTIECESAVGVGTRFTITIDLPIADKITSELVLPAMHILLVDDDTVFIDTAKDTLEELGITADAVTTGAEAVSTVVEMHERGRDYPAVIVDLRLPDMDGIAVTRTIRERVGDEVPIIIISAYDHSEVEELAKAAGANGFISKPFFRSTVYKSMTEILGISEAERSDDQSEDMSSLSDMNILIAEDNDLNWEIAREILAMYGVSTERAENGKACVEMLERAAEGEYDLVLMDIQMPIMNGYEATAAIRSSRIEHVRSIPIIAMTADAFADDIQKCLAAGMNAHIAKPINVNNLLTIIKKNFGGEG